MLTKSQVYAVVREVINFKKFQGDTSDVTAHVETPNFSTILQFIHEHADTIVIKRPDQLNIAVSSHRDRLNHLFKLPKNLSEEYEYCTKRYEDGG
ncbi:LEF-11 [Plodia interpunctella granulovirus]|uniref:Late expression factor 11 n=1 Tax=Plodia interpunctella granulovirus TaxID=262175 RepID=A0A1L5JGL3_9BBAC|nr:LEF-11 [Plodia interpunctella granulovirus]APO13934.1 LEF-11 [Plodia interpunctella granulovirus]